MILKATLLMALRLILKDPEGTYVASQTKGKQAVGGLLKSDGSPTVDIRDTASSYSE